MEPAFCADLVAAWWNGEELKDCVLWGHRILIWGRFGKLAEFIAALVIVIDIIGPERLNRFATTVDEAVAWSSCKGERAITWILERTSEVIGVVFIFAPERRRKLSGGTLRFLFYIKDRWYRSVAASLISAVISISLFVPLVIASASLQPEYRLMVRVVAGLVVFVPFAAYVLAGLLVNALYLRFFRALLVQPAIWVLSRPYIATMARIGSVVVLIAGFSFDLLAS